MNSLKPVFRSLDAKLHWPFQHRDPTLTHDCPYIVCAFEPTSSFPSSTFEAVFHRKFVIMIVIVTWLRLDYQERGVALPMFMVGIEQSGH